MAAPRFRLGWRAILLALAAALSPHASLAQGGTTTDIITGTVTGSLNAAFNGASDVVLARQRLVNISSRARVISGGGSSISHP